MKKVTFISLLLSACLGVNGHLWAQERVLDTAWHHLRNTGSREWSEFPLQANNKLQFSFTSRPNTTEHTLSIRQYDVKLGWHVKLNGLSLGSLVEDEKDLLCYLKIPPEYLRESNTLEIYSPDNKTTDDIKAGEITLYAQALEDLLGQAHVAIEVFDQESKQRIPARLTVVNARGILQLVTASGEEPFALRAGHIYSGTGKLRLGLPPGSYTVYASRGFEYGVDSARIELRPGDRLQQAFTIRREVSTAGWVSSDTHIHTFTWSRHGDASTDERVVTIAGEGIELPIATDHNIHVNLQPVAAEHGLDRYFTAVTGNEVTTPVGHFNVFPATGDAVINHAVKDWKGLEQNFADRDSKVIILNHARDIHSGFRPFDPSRHISSAGMRLDGWQLPADGMEIINSGSQQTDQMELTRDWFGMLNGGHFITPAGSSDSHDVSRFIVGQARTYIRCNDDDPGQIDVQDAVKNFKEGNVMVSFGLLAEIEINDSYGPGELVPGSDEARVRVKVSGPAWSRATYVTLYANGKKIREEKIVNENGAGEKWSGDWNLTMPAQDIYLVAVATGPGGSHPFWPIAKPYQPVSTHWDPRVFGVSGAVWLDGDRNGKRNSARDYAIELHRQAGRDLAGLIQSLAAFDESVSVQVAALLHQKGKDLRGAELTQALQKASPETKSGFAIVIDELHRSTP